MITAQMIAPVGNDDDDKPSASHGGNEGPFPRRVNGMDVPVMS